MDKLKPQEARDLLRKLVMRVLASHQHPPIDEASSSQEESLKSLRGQGNEGVKVIKIEDAGSHLPRLSHQEAVEVV